jgi:hypothetical protein
VDDEIETSPAYVPQLVNVTSCISLSPGYLKLNDDLSTVKHGETVRVTVVLAVLVPELVVMDPVIIP